MYRLVFERNSIQELNKLDKKVKERIWIKLQECKLNPFRFFIKLVEISGYKLRVGDWRIIADIFQEKEAIIILKIWHRKNIYEF